MSFRYSDIENIHTSSVQQKFRDSLKSLTRDVLVIDFSKTSEILKEHGLESFSYDTVSTQVSTGLSMTEIITYIVNRAIQHEDKNEILELLVYVMITSSNLCFTGQITNWLSVLGGYFSDIDMGINKYDQITNYLDYLKYQCTSDRLFEKFYTFISDFDVTDIEREAYLDALIDYILEDKNDEKYSLTHYDPTSITIDYMIDVSSQLFIHTIINALNENYHGAFVHTPIQRFPNSNIIFELSDYDSLYSSSPNKQTVERAVRYTNNDFYGDETILNLGKKLVLPKPTKIKYPKKIYKLPKISNFNGKHNYSKNYR